MPAAVSFADLTAEALEAVTPRCRQAASAVKGKSTWHEPSPMPSKPTVMRLCRPAPAPASARLSRPGSAVGRPTVIATATKRSRISSPGRSPVQPITSTSVPLAVLKGRSNYLCLQRLDELEADDDSISTSTTPNETAARSTATLDELRAFATTSATGRSQQLKRSTTAPGACPVGRRMPRGEIAREATTVSLKARHKAEADILVVNLHLYALAITVDAVLPEHDLVMIDEAHQLEDIVAEAAGRQISPARVQAAARNTASVLDMGQSEPRSRPRHCMSPSNP